MREMRISEGAKVKTMRKILRTSREVKRRRKRKTLNPKARANRKERIKNKLRRLLLKNLNVNSNDL